VFVVFGAVLQGGHGIETLRSLTEQTSSSATVTVFAAAATIVLMTLLRLPSSTSQAVVGAIVGVGLMQRRLELAPLTKVVICWLATPLGALVCYVVFHRLLAAVFRRWRPSLSARDQFLRAMLVACGCYGAYALGANNVANVTGVFVGEGMLTARSAVWLGALSIAGGIIGFSRPVMMTVGRGIVRMDAFAAFVAVLSHAVTVHVFAMVGVPVSSSQAIVGAVLGIGLVKGLQVVRGRTLVRVVLGWVSTPVLAGLVAALLLFVARMDPSG
jgi:PiT family inorganic phosphate transporter